MNANFSRCFSYFLCLLILAPHTAFGFSFDKKSEPTQCHRDIEEWPRKIQELQEQTVCTTGSFKDCSFMLNSGAQEKANLSYVSTALVGFSPFIGKALKRFPSIWSILPSPPPKKSWYERRKAISAKPFPTVSPDMVAEEYGALRDSYASTHPKSKNTVRTSYARDFIPSSKGPTTHVALVRSTEDLARNLVVAFGELPSFTQMDDEFLKKLVVEMGDNPVRYAEALAQITSSFSEKIAYLDSNILAGLNEITDDKERGKVLKNIVRHSGVVENSVVTSDDIIESVLKEGGTFTEVAETSASRSAGRHGVQEGLEGVATLESAPSFESISVQTAEAPNASVAPKASSATPGSQHSKELKSLINDTRQARVLRVKQAHFEQQLGRIVHKKGFSVLPGAKKFFSYYYYRRLLTSLRALGGFNSKIKSPWHIAEAIHFFENYSNTPIRIHGKYNVVAANPIAPSTNESFVNKMARSNTAYDSIGSDIYNLKEAIKSPSLKGEINKGLQTYGKQLGEHAAIQGADMEVLKGISQVFVDFSDNVKNPTGRVSQAIKFSGDMIKQVQKFLKHDAVKRVADKFAKTAAAEKVKAVLLKRVAVWAAAGPGLAVGVLGAFADIDLYYMGWCAIDNRIEPEAYHPFYYNDCTNMSPGFEQREESNVFVNIIKTFSSLDENPDDNLDKQLEILSNSERSCKYFTKAHENLVKRADLEKMSCANENEASSLTQGFRKNVRYRLLMENGEPAGIEYSSTIERPKLKVKNRGVYKMSELGYESFERSSIAGEKILSTIFIDDKNVKTDPNGIENMDLVFVVKSAMRDLVRKHYCCNGELDGAACEGQ